MYEKVLPHRFSIQWKKGDLGVFNNRRFIHSSTPARNYLEFEDISKILLLQTFLPTKRPLYGLRPFYSGLQPAMKTKWNMNRESFEKTYQDFNSYYTQKYILNSKYTIIE